MRIAIGDVFTRLTAIEDLGMKNRHHIWKCQCECGRECIAREDKLIEGRTKSCGCLQPQLNAIRGDLSDQSAILKSTLRELKKTLLLANQLASRNLFGRAKQLSNAVSQSAAIDYRQFEYTGPPRLAAKLLVEWAALVNAVLPYGPEHDAVTIKVDLSITKHP